MRPAKVTAKALRAGFPLKDKRFRNRLYTAEITVLGSMAVLHSFAPALQLLATGAVRVQPLLTHAFPLERDPDALEAVRRGEGPKIQLLPKGETLHG
jgi:threonine dehydrogenase-like Zn-dependent dehydrogenase